MQYNFDRIVHRSNTNSIKWDYLFEDGMFIQRPFGPDPLAPDQILPLSLADMDFPTAQPIIDALTARAQNGIFGYTFPGDEYYKAIIDWFQRRHHWSVQQDWITTNTGVMQSINLILQTFTDLDDHVIMQSPGFGPISDAIVNNGRNLITSPLRFQDGRYTMDFDDLASKAADPRAKLFILCSPHNPVGRVWTLDELSQLGEICLDNDLLLISDEIHSELLYSWAEFTSFGTIDERFIDRFILCTSASKSFNLPGLRTSLTIIPNEDLRGRFLTSMRNLNELFGVNTFGTLALQTAFQQGEGWLEQVMAYIETNYHTLAEFLGRHLPQLHIVQPEALYLIWIDCTELGMTSAAIRKLLLDEARVLIESGSGYGSEGEGFIRVNIACPRPILLAALNRIRDALERSGQVNFYEDLSRHPQN